MNGHNSIGFILRFKALTGEGNGNPLQYSLLENSIDRGAWWAAVHEFAESNTTDQLTLVYYYKVEKK